MPRVEHIEDIPTKHIQLPDGSTRGGVRMLEARFVADDWDDPRLYYVEVDSESVEEWKEILSEEYREHVARYGVEIPEFIRDRHWSCTRPKLVKIEVMPPLVDVDA